MLKSLFAKFSKSNVEVKTENNNIVCGCFNVTESDIKNAIDKGAKSFKEVQDMTKVGTGCGSCVSSNEELVNGLLMQKKLDDNQIVCGCFNIKEQDIAEAVKNGAKSFEEVQKVTKVGTGCGNCVASNKALVDYILKI